MDCQCEKCKQACIRKPGWFLPGEAEKVAAHLGMTLQELFKTKLAVDYWVSAPRDIYVLSPATTKNSPGTVFPFDPFGTCVFFINGLCEIHPVKPCECRDTMACQGGSDGLHKRVAMAWSGHQGQIEALLDTAPESEPVSVSDVLSLLTGMD